jgi:hypothetical protein
MEKNFLGNNVERLVIMCSIVLFVLVYVIRFIYTSAYTPTWDTVDFALAIHEFDLLKMQPHFPGYPYFILGGMFVSRWIDDPARALSILNVFLNVTAVFPVYWITKRWHSTAVSVVLTLSVQVIAFSMVMSGAPNSEGAAIAILWWYLWSLLKAKENRNYMIQLIPLFIFSVLMGVRLSYLPFGGGIFLLWIVKWKENRSILSIVSQLILAVVFQMVWVFGLILSEGSITNFINLALNFTNGHFNEWGGSVQTSSLSLIERVIVLCFHNIFWSGFSAETVGLAFIMFAFLFHVVVVWLRNRTLCYSETKALFLLLGLYIIWALFAQNIEKARHILPLLGPSLLVFMHVYVKTGVNKLKLTMLFVLIIANLVVGIQHIREQAIKDPAVYQLAWDLEKMDDQLSVYTWEETRVFDYLNVSFQHKRILTFDYFLQQLKYEEGKRIFVTDKVIEGFKQQTDQDLKRFVTKVNKYESNHLFDPIYSEIILYEWKKEEE